MEKNSRMWRKQNQGRSKSGTPLWRAGRRLVGASAMILLGGLAGIMLIYDGGGKAVAEPAIPRSAALASWDANGTGGNYLLRIVEGNLAATEKPVSGTVISDATCEPDAQGFSHCHNTILLAEGAQVTVVNTHLMNRHPCLYPGERVSISKIDASWVVATVAHR